MKKVFLLLAGGLLFTAATKAQSYQRPVGSEFSIGVSPMLPVGDFHNAYSFGIGADLKYAYNFDETIAATVSAGYNNFFGKTVAQIGGSSIKYKDQGFIPLKAGVRFSMGQFYAEPQIGAAFSTNSENERITKNSTSLTYAGQIGVMVNPKFDLSLRYEGISTGYNKANGNAATLGALGLRLAYTF